MPDEKRPTYELRPNTGVLFKNKYKGDNPKAPNCTGSALLELEDGTTVERDVVGWTRKTRSGEKYLSLPIKPKVSRQSARGNRNRDKDDIPFGKDESQF
jgi:hypothetical protein